MMEAVQIDDCDSEFDYDDYSSSASGSRNGRGKQHKNLLKETVGNTVDSESNLAWLADQFTADLAAQSVFECLTDVLFFGVHERDGVVSDGQQNKDTVKVKVLATTVPQRPDISESREPGLDIDAGLLRSHFVGLIQKNGNDPRERRDPNDDGLSLVTSIRKCPFKARYITLPSSELIIIPNSADPGEAVSIISTFLPAFETLHHGDRRVRDSRYSPSSLKGKQVLITGGDSLEAQAAVKLAVWAGAAGVFVLNAGNVLSKRIHGGHVAVLAEDPKVWLPVVQGDMDVVIDFEYPNNFQSVIASLTRKGRLVCKYPKRDGRNQSPSPVSKFLGQSALCAMSRASIFDFDEYIRTNFEDVKKDILFLFRLLERRRIRPSIDRYVKLRDIPIVQEEMRTHAMVGAVVCEPWNTKR